MECSCGGTLIEGKSCFSSQGKYYYILIEDIPAYQCTRCGKVLFKEDVVDKIKNLEKKIERESKVIVTGKHSTNLSDY